MMNQNRITDIYNSLRTLGPLSADEVPMRLAQQAMDAGLTSGDHQQCVAAVADFSRIASYGTLSEFEMLLTTRRQGKAEKDGLSASAWPEGVDSCEGVGS